MKATRLVICLAVLGAVLFPTLSHGQLRSFQDFLYVTYEEQTIFNEIIWFWSPDLLDGKVYINDEFGCKGSPHFTDSVFTTANELLQGGGYDPIFDVEPVVNAPDWLPPQSTATLEETAVASGTFYLGDEENLQFRCTGNVSGWLIEGWPRATPYDEQNVQLVEMVQYGEADALFFSGAIELSGDRIQDTTVIGAHGTIRIVDNLMYDGLDITSIPDRLPDSLTHYLGVVSNSSIVVANTWANGRGNGLNRHNGIHDSSHVVITASLRAFPSQGGFRAYQGSFTFEDQNDTWDTYRWCDPLGPNPNEPDERGSIYLYGSLAMYRRGYVHRSNCGGTGYAKQYHYDDRLANHPLDLLPEPDYERFYQTWEDTTVVLDRPFTIYRGELILGPGATVQYDPVEGLEQYYYAPFQANSRGKLFIQGTPDNPVTIQMPESDTTFALVQYHDAAHVGGLYADSLVHDLVVEGRNLNIELPQQARNVHVSGEDVTLQLLDYQQDTSIVDSRWEQISVDANDLSLGLPVCLDSFDFEAAQVALGLDEGMDLPDSVTTTMRQGVLTGDLFASPYPYSRSIDRLERCEVLGRMESRFEVIDHATFACSTGQALLQSQRALRLRNSFFQGYDSLVAGQDSALVFASYCGWFGLDDGEPYNGYVIVEGPVLEDVDPLFVEPDSGDYHLQPGSPLIDAGDPDSPLDPDGTVTDIGAFYYDQLDAPEDTESGGDLPATFGIAGVYPNPFNPTAEIRLHLPRRGQVEVEVLNVLGQRVATLHDGSLQPGTHTLTLDGRRLASGTYFVKAKLGTDVAVKRVVLLK